VILGERLDVWLGEYRRCRRQLRESGWSNVGDLWTHRDEPDSGMNFMALTRHLGESIAREARRSRRGVRAFGLDHLPDGALPSALAGRPLLGMRSRGTIRRRLKRWFDTPSSSSTQAVTAWPPSSGRAMFTVRMGGTKCSSLSLTGTAHRFGRRQAALPSTESPRAVRPSFSLPVGTATMPQIGTSHA
jgi:hypothetical protein